MGSGLPSRCRSGPLRVSGAASLAEGRTARVVVQLIEDFRRQDSGRALLSPSLGWQSRNDPAPWGAVAYCGACRRTDPAVGEWRNGDGDLRAGAAAVALGTQGGHQPERERRGTADARRSGGAGARSGPAPRRAARVHPVERHAGVAVATCRALRGGDDWARAGDDRLVRGELRRGAGARRAGRRSRGDRAELPAGGASGTRPRGRRAGRAPSARRGRIDLDARLGGVRGRGLQADEAHLPEPSEQPDRACVTSDSRSELRVWRGVWCTRV